MTICNDIFRFTLQYKVTLSEHCLHVDFNVQNTGQYDPSSIWISDHQTSLSRPLLHAISSLSSYTFLSHYLSVQLLTALITMPSLIFQHTMTPTSPTHSPHPLPPHSQNRAVPFSVDLSECQHPYITHIYYIPTLIHSLILNYSHATYPLDLSSHSPYIYPNPTYSLFPYPHLTSSIICLPWLHHHAPHLMNPSVGVQLYTQST